MYDIWREKIELAEQVYDSENIRIIVNETDNSFDNTCVIYCSSNNVWFPNEEEFFRKSFIENDYYEWTKHRVRGAKKEIWVRDIYKSWYVTGINSRVNDIDKLIDLLSEETKGYDVILVGSSAGGYLAALLSKPLNARYALVFSAQFDLRIKGAMSDNPFLQKYDNTYRSKYYNLSDYLRDSNVRIYYIYPNLNTQDLCHYRKVCNLKNIKAIGLKSKRHGMVVYKCCVDKLINKTQEELDDLFELYNAKTPFYLSINVVGIYSTVRYLVEEVLKKIK